MATSAQAAPVGPLSHETAQALVTAINNCMQSFDDERPVGPFSFDLELPAEYVAKNQSQ